MSAYRVAAALTLTALLMSSGRAETPAADDVQDLLVLTDARPLRLRIHITLDGKPFRAAAADYALADQPLGTAPSPIVVDDHLVASTNRTGGVGVKVSLDGDKPAAARTWQNADLTGYFSTPVAVGKDHFYMVTTTLLPQPAATLRCIDAKTGKELWNEPKVGFFHAALLRTGDDRLLMLDDAGVLKLFAHDPKGYRELAKAKVCGSTSSAPALANGRLYARDDKGVLCIQIEQ